MFKGNVMSLLNFSLIHLPERKKILNEKFLSLTVVLAVIVMHC